MCGRLHVWSATCVVSYMCGWVHVWSATCVVSYICGWLHVLLAACVVGCMWYQSFKIECSMGIPSLYPLIEKGSLVGESPKWELRVF